MRPTSGSRSSNRLWRAGVREPLSSTFHLKYQLTLRGGGGAQPAAVSSFGSTGCVPQIAAVAPAATVSLVPQGAGSGSDPTTTRDRVLKATAQSRVAGYRPISCRSSSSVTHSRFSKIGCRKAIPSKTVYGLPKPYPNGSVPSKTVYGEHFAAAWIACCDEITCLFAEVTRFSPLCRSARIYLRCRP
jgi:hypothetical protein